MTFFPPRTKLNGGTTPHPHGEQRKLAWKPWGEHVWGGGRRSLLRNSTQEKLMQTRKVGCLTSLKKSEEKNATGLKKGGGVLGGGGGGGGGGGFWWWVWGGWERFFIWGGGPFNNTRRVGRLLNGRASFGKSLALQKEDIKISGEGKNRESRRCVGGNRFQKETFNSTP